MEISPNLGVGVATVIKWAGARDAESSALSKIFLYVEESSCPECLFRNPVRYDSDSEWVAKEGGRQDFGEQEIKIGPGHRRILDVAY